MDDRCAALLDDPIMISSRVAWLAAKRPVLAPWVTVVAAVLIPLTCASQTAIAPPRPAMVGSTAPVAQSVLSIRATVSLKPGYPQAVARTTFYLVDDSLANILKSAGVTIKGRDGKDKLAQTEDDYAIWFGFGANNLRMLPIGDFYGRAMTTLRPHILQTVISDFDGRARFAPVKFGTYFLLGVARTPKGFAAWQLKTPLEAGAVDLPLTERNAVVVQ